MTLAALDDAPAPDLSSVFDLQRLFDHPDPYPGFAAARRQAPVATFEMLGQQVYAALGFDAVEHVLHDATTFSSRGNGQAARFMGPTIVVMDGAQHARMRAVVRGSFAPRVIAALEPEIAALARDLVARFAVDRRADLVAALAVPFPIAVIARILGIPPERHARFLEWSLALIGFPRDPAHAMDAADALRLDLLPLVAQRRRAPRDDVISRIVASTVDGVPLDDDEVVNFLRLLIPAGAETTSRLLGNLLFALLDDPGRYRRVQADRTLVAAAIAETLRWETPVPFVARRTTCAAELGGLSVPARAYVLAVTGSANRDETRYVAPDRFDLDRAPDEHLAFGAGRHFCLGYHLARLETAAALTAVLDAIRAPRFAADAPRPTIQGLAFRSPPALPVRFETA